MTLVTQVSLYQVEATSLAPGRARSEVRLDRAFFSSGAGLLDHPFDGTLPLMSRRSGTPRGWRAGAVLVVGGILNGCVSPESNSLIPASEVDLTAEESIKPPGPTGIIHLPGGIECRLDSREVLIPASIAIDSGWIEQIACLRGTREHESIFVVECQPSLVHSALLMIGLESGVPGRWLETKRDDRYEIERIAPTGAPVRIQVRFTDTEGRCVESSVEEMVMGAPDGAVFPPTPWMFCGSRFDGEGRYVADYSGSLVGFATFGDEVLGLPGVISDQVSVDAAVWEIRSDKVPAPGTPVSLVLTPWDA